jgi:hypothetical protein
MYCPCIGARGRADASVADDASCNSVTGVDCVKTVLEILRPNRFAHAQRSAAQIALARRVLNLTR